MELEFSSKLTFIPKWKGNRDAAEVDRITVVYHNPTSAMKSRLQPKAPLLFSFDPVGNVKGGETSISSDRKALVDGMLIRIDGLSYRMDGEKKIVSDARSLWEAPSYYDGLIDELSEQFKLELEKKVDEKN